MSQTRGILQQLNKDSTNCLTIPTHEATESHFQHLSEVDFWAIWNKNHKKWNSSYRPVPDNYHLLYNHSEKLPLWLDFDFVLTQNKFGQFQHLGPIAQELQLPLISVEHTAKMPWWKPQQMQQLKGMRGTANIFISDWSIDSWEWERGDDTFVIEHTINSDVFVPNEKIREDRLLVVANDLIGRDAVLDWKLCQKVTSKFPTKFVGDTPGLSVPAKGLPELVSEYQRSKIFLNTAPLSPIPTSMLEAMSCGCIPISVATCAIPSYIKDGENGLLASDEAGLVEAVNIVLNDPDLAQTMSENARNTILERCNITRWVKQWKEVIDYVLT